jgi:hypothetical protein
MGLLFLRLVGIDWIPFPPADFRVGQYVSEDIRARISFKVLSPELQGDLQRNRQITTPPVFKFNMAMADEIIASLKNLPDQMEATTQPADLDASLKGTFMLDGEGLGQVQKVWSDTDRLAQYNEQVQALGDRFKSVYTVTSEDVHPRVQRSAEQAIMVHDDRRNTSQFTDLVRLTEVDKLAAKVRYLTRSFDPAIQPHVYYYLLNKLKDQPLYTHDPAQTQKDIEEAQRTILTNPPDAVYVEYAVGQVLVPQSRRPSTHGDQVAALSQAERKLLIQEQQAYYKSERITHPVRFWGAPVGRALVLFLITLLLGLYIFCYQPRIVENHWRGLVMVLLFVSMAAMAKFMVFGVGLNPYSALLPILFGTILLTIAYDQRFSLAMGAALSVLAVFLLRQDFALMTIMFSAVATAVLELREIRSRSKLIAVSTVVASVAALVTTALGLAQQVPIRFIMIDVGWAAVAALMAGLIIQGLLPLIERVFHIATSLTLLEWCDASKPLLKRLAMEAPGTYNHSLQLGSMCESAAEAIGARGLLARVGAYYHDIGKINKPTYFVENEGGSPSRHDKLSPAMSLLIIIGHVKDGLEMAREYGLPSVLWPFIGTHHGTTLVQYFYQAATERAGNDHRAPDEVEFRYPGPKPRTKECAILMLADVAESSVRAMSEPTPTRIENQVHAMVTRRLMDGQLDDCEMTLREVHEVEQSLIKSLCGIYHARIAYAAPAGQRPSAAEQQSKPLTSTRPDIQDEPDESPEDKNAVSGE